MRSSEVRRRGDCQCKGYRDLRVRRNVLHGFEQWISSFSRSCFKVSIYRSVMPCISNSFPGLCGVEECHTLHCHHPASYNLRFPTQHSTQQTQITLPSASSSKIEVPLCCLLLQSTSSLCQGRQAPLRVRQQQQQQRQQLGREVQRAGQREGEEQVHRKQVIRKIHSRCSVPHCTLPAWSSVTPSPLALPFFLHTPSRDSADGFSAIELAGQEDMHCLSS